jgi:hypothetical protein
MLVKESRMLEVSIFRALDTNAHRIDFNVVLPDVMVIADEVDSQLDQAMESYTAVIERLPHEPICIHYPVSNQKRQGKDHEECPAIRCPASPPRALSEWSPSGLCCGPFTVVGIASRARR